jgi:surface antigen
MFVRIADTPYHGSGKPRLKSAFSAVALVCLLGLVAGGCAMSMELGSLFGKDDDAKTTDKSDARDVTASLQLVSTRSESSMTSTDWSLATIALREALAKNEDGMSVPWLNPNTGTRGTVTPIASAYVQAGSACRNFLASRVGDGQEGWFEGTACRGHAGQWDVRSTRALNNR